jgi:hypothetical protein
VDDLALNQLGCSATVFCVDLKFYLFSHVGLANLESQLTGKKPSSDDFKPPPSHDLSLGCTQPCKVVILLHNVQLLHKYKVATKSVIL